MSSIENQNIFISDKLYSTLMAETVTIPKEEYEKLKNLEEIDMELLSELVQGLKDIKEGRVKPWD